MIAAALSCLFTGVRPSSAAATSARPIESDISQAADSPFDLGNHSGTEAPGEMPSSKTVLSPIRESGPAPITLRAEA